MKKLIIYEYQASQIEDTFRLVARCMESGKRATSVDRDVMQSWQMIKNVIAENIDEPASRFDRSQDERMNLPAHFAMWLNKLEDIIILEACKDDDDLQMAINLQNYYIKYVYNE